MKRIYYITIFLLLPFTGIMENTLFAQKKINLDNREWVFNDEGFCESIDNKHPYYWSDYLKYFKTKRNIYIPSPWESGLFKFVELTRNGNIYTYPTGCRFNDGRLTFYVDKSHFNASRDYDFHSRRYSALQVEINMIKIGDLVGPLNKCFNNLDWTKVAVFLPQSAFCWSNWDKTILAYTVLYEKSIPKEAWDEARKIKSAFPGLLVDDYVYNEYGGLYEQATISKIDNKSLTVVNNVILPNITYPSMRMTCFKDNCDLYCFQSHKEEDDLCIINSKHPLYRLNYTDFSVKWVFVPQDGETIIDIEEDSKGKYLLLFGSTTEHGYIGYDNPMIIVLDANSGKEYKRWYYSTPLKGKITSVKPITKNLIYFSTDAYQRGRYNEEVIDIDLFIEGGAIALYQLGKRYENEKNYTEALKCYRESAEQGYDKAQLKLGMAYHFGNLGVSRDYSEAAKWFRKAAEQGEVVSQYTFALDYVNGLGVSRDYSEAVKWYRKAAEQGYPLAQNNLGAMYAAGNGVSQDYSEAVKWVRKAAEQGHALAQRNLANYYRKGQGVPQDYSEAVKWYKKAAEQGDAVAQFQLGVCFENGNGVPQNNTEAVKWYRKAADKGHKEAKNRLESLL